MRPVVGFARILLVCGGAGSNQGELLLVGNFRGLSAGIAIGPLDVSCPVRGVVCCLKGYTNRPN